MAAVTAELLVVIVEITLVLAIKAVKAEIIRAVAMVIVMVSNPVTVKVLVDVRLF